MTEILAAVIGAIAAGGVGFFLGRSQAQQQVFSESQTKALTEIRLAVLSVTNLLKNWVARVAGAADASPPVENPAFVSLATVSELMDEGEEIRGELLHLLGLYHIHKPHLGPRVRRVLTALTAKSERTCNEIWIALKIRAEMEEAIATFYEEGEPNYYDAALQRAARDAWAWVSGEGAEDLNAQLLEFEREVERAVGNLPWWRQWLP